MTLLSGSLILALTACGAPQASSPTTPAAPEAAASSTVPTESVSAPDASGTPSASAAPTPTVTASTPAPPQTPETKAKAALARMNLTQKAGQLIALATHATGSTLGAAETALKGGVGNYYLAGRTYAGTAATAGVVNQLDAAVKANGSGVKAYAASDQEGGQVQVLHGPGFSEMPSALAQGQMTPAALQQAAAGWGAELDAAGLNMDLGPVMDTVPSAAFAPSNMPIGHYQRNFGFTPEAVSASGNAVVKGLGQASVSPVVKHFPGLGRVVGNTDVTANVHDSQTTRTDAFLKPFTDAIRAGAPWVMVSSAIYDLIDPSQPAAFSPTTMAMLRQDAGFTGGIMSDDLCQAVQVSSYGMGERAVNFIAAGGSLVLCQIPARSTIMLQALVAKAQADPAFANKVDAAALVVLTQKARAGLI